MQKYLSSGFSGFFALTRSLAHDRLQTHHHHYFELLLATSRYIAASLITRLLFKKKLE